jgi:hypothetical protein
MQFHDEEYIKYLSTFVSSNEKKIYEDKGMNEYE